jgi:hypothetical protein
VAPRALPTRTSPVRSAKALEATFLLTCGRVVLLLARRWVDASRRTILRLSVLQTYVYTSWRCLAVQRLTCLFLLHTGQRVGRRTRDAGSLRTVRSCHQSFPCPGQRDPEGQGLRFHLLRRSGGRTACLRQDGRLYVLLSPALPKLLSTNLQSSQSVTATLSCASSLRSALDLFFAILTTFLAPFPFSFQAGLPTPWVKLFQFVLYD